MARCPDCGGELAEDGLCPHCGRTAADGQGPAGDTSVPEAAGGAERDGGVELICEHCGEGKMVLAEEHPKYPLYMCDDCSWYMGNLLRLGVVLYYDTRILKVARHISAEIHRLGSYSQRLGEHSDAEGFAALASRLSVELDMEPGPVKDSLEYLMGNDVLEAVFSDEGDGRALALRFVGSGTAEEIIEP